MSYGSNSEKLEVSSDPNQLKHKSYEVFEGVKLPPDNKGNLSASYFPNNPQLELARLTTPSYSGLLESLSKIDISFIFNTTKYNESRRGTRPCFSELHGPGSELVMPLSGSYLSSAGLNSVFMPGVHKKILADSSIKTYEAIDSKAVEYMQYAGFLGKKDDSVIYISDLNCLRDSLKERNRKVYSIDSYGTDFNPYSANSQEAFDIVNSKSWVSKLTNFAPIEYRCSVHEANQEMYDLASDYGNKVLYLKTCNTETASVGVYRICDYPSFTSLISEIRLKTLEFNLDETIILQPEITGVNKSFQVFIDSNYSDDVQVIALTDQIIGEDKVTYMGNLNHQITPERLKPIGPAILDLVDGIKKLAPEVFGFVMCDYFETESGEMILIDPGLRATGNTPAAMVKIWFEHNNPGADVTVTNFVYPRDGLTYDKVASKLGAYANPDYILKTGYGVLPWGHNHIGGKSMFMFVTPNKEEYEPFKAKIFNMLS